MNLLDMLLAIPLAGFLLTLLLPRRNEDAIRVLSLAVALAAFVLSLVLPAGFEQQSTDLIWIPSLDIHYHVAADGLSLWLVLLPTFLTPIVILISWRHITNRIKEFYAFLLLLEFGLVGVFLAQDLFLFYVFWEISLVPMYFLIGIWGHERRIYAAVKFFLYTMTGSVLMLAAIIYIYNRGHTFDYAQILAMFESGRLHFNANEQMLLFLAFFIAFAIKVPLFPLHTWLPDAHVEAPSAGSVMLASVMLKMGTYGLVRFCLPMFPGPARRCAPWIVTLAIIGIIYGALVAMNTSVEVRRTLLRDLKPLFLETAEAERDGDPLGAAIWFYLAGADRSAVLAVESYLAPPSPGTRRRRARGLQRRSSGRSRTSTSTPPSSARSPARA